MRMKKNAYHWKKQRQQFRQGETYTAPLRFLIFQTLRVHFKTKDGNARNTIRVLATTVSVRTRTDPCNCIGEIALHLAEKLAQNAKA